MKSILQGPKEEKVEEKKYPYLGIFKDGEVVLSASPTIGVTVHDPAAKDTHPVGHYSKSWAEGDAEPLKGKIILSN